MLERRAQVIEFVSNFFSIGNITIENLNSCFNYKEGKVFSITEIVEKIYRDMASNANDNISHQLRVGKNGDVYISTITRADEIDDLQFRWGSWSALNRHVGPFAASNNNYIKQSFEDLKKCWERGVTGYCDYCRIL